MIKEDEGEKKYFYLVESFMCLMINEWLFCPPQSWFCSMCHWRYLFSITTTLTAHIFLEDS